MHRLLSQGASSYGRLGRAAVQAWNDFFFTPASPVPLALVRVVVGSLLTWDLATLRPDLRDYLGADGWISTEALRDYLARNSPGAWSFWLLVPDAWLFPVWLACLVVATAFALGFATRITAVLAWVVAISTARRAPVTLFGFDQMNTTWILYVAVSGAGGQAISLDRWLESRRFRRARRPKNPPQGVPSTGVPVRETVSANLSLRLIQMHLAIVYGSSGLSKLMGPEWWDGTALEKILLTPEFRCLDPTLFLAHPLLLQLATHAAVALEIGYPVLIWIRPLRPLVLTALVLMHLGIAQTLGLTEFSLSMVGANLAFLTGWTASSRSAAGGSRSASEPRASVAMPAATRRSAGARRANR